MYDLLEGDFYDKKKKTQSRAGGWKKEQNLNSMNTVDFMKKVKFEQSL